MTQSQIDTPSTSPAPLFAWLYPDGHQHRLTIGPHIDEPLATIAVVTYRQDRRATLSLMQAAKALAEIHGLKEE